jgi:hypothetical protein
MTEIVLSLVVVVQLLIIIWLVRLLLISKFSPDKIQTVVEATPKLPTFTKDEEPKPSGDVNLLDMEFEEIQNKNIDVRQVLNG